MIRYGQGTIGKMSSKRRSVGFWLAASLLASPALAGTGGESRNGLGVEAVVVQTCRVSTGEATAVSPGHLFCSIGTSLPTITTAATPVDRVQPAPAGGERTRYVTITY